MVLVIADVLDAETARAFLDKAGKLEWRDGRVTAGATAKGAKQNEQADLTSPSGRKLQEALAKIIASHSVLIAAARPKRFSNLLLSRTEKNGRYAPHIDNALMQKNGAPLRSDLSFTLFLTPPDTYEGGELVIHTAGAAQTVKGRSGDLVLYPSSSIHE
ncbi:MAG: Fe2+-dependent dioxygenase, partial [Pseudomonadota bacterium]